ncbi:hypothetical protein; putative exported protein [Xenorhabdus bovienii SS-2004]|uniref:Uncharacterized protein n=1 Tax=Xenorhabdus bovienii (strain SS-2004) TaxID=406818 RepID=D3V2W7_XENBS|nr:hypothetical protein; putative exported protein [Xenorhabdus bovienii SS-2004]
MINNYTFHFPVAALLAATGNLLGIGYNWVSFCSIWSEVDTALLLIS